MLSSNLAKYQNATLILLLTLVIIVFDQVSKLYVSKLLDYNFYNSREILPFLNLVFVKNTGISFGLFSEGGSFQRWFLTIFSGVVGVFLLIWAMLSEKGTFRIALCLISSGAIGNSIDRFYFGGVIDFIDFFVYNFHWPSFNVADTSIFFGVIFLILDNFKNGRV